MSPTRAPPGRSNCSSRLRYASSAQRLLAAALRIVRAMAPRGCATHRARNGSSRLRYASSAQWLLAAALRIVAALLPDRYVLIAFARERLARPALPAVAQSQSGDACHQVEFGRPHVPERKRPELAPPFGNRDVVRAHLLRGDVIQ